MNPFRRPGPAIATLLILVTGSAFLTQVVPYRQILDSERQVDEARANLDRLTEENTRLQADVDALQTDPEIERLAREKLGYVRPGETAFVVVDPPAVETEETETAPEEEPVEDKTWVDAFWDFLTGADVEP